MEKLDAQVQEAKALHKTAIKYRAAGDEMGIPAPMVEALGSLKRTRYAKASA